eukprot:6135057-Pyramimonas_sp.AAC.1
MRRMVTLRRHPSLAAAIRSITPIGTPCQGRATGSPASSAMAVPTVDQPGHRQSALEERRFMQTTSPCSHV